MTSTSVRYLFVCLAFSASTSLLAASVDPSAQSIAAKATQAQIVNYSIYADATARQYDGIVSLGEADEQDLAVSWDQQNKTPSSLIGLMRCYQVSGIAEALKIFTSEHWQDLDNIYALTDSDSFDTTYVPVFRRGIESAYRIYFTRKYNGYPVLHNGIEMLVTRGYGISQAPETMGISAGGSGAFCFRAIFGNMFRDMYISDSIATVSASDALLVATITAGVEFKTYDIAMLVYITEAQESRLAYRIDLIGDESMTVFVDAVNLGVIQTQPGIVNKHGTVRVAATRPHELYVPYSISVPGSGKSSFQPLPYVPIFGQTNYTESCRGDTSYRLGETDYHGNFNETPAGVFQSCPNAQCTNGCLALDYLLDESYDYLKDATPGPDLWWPGDDFGVENYPLIFGNINAKPDYANYDAPWMPANGAYAACNYTADDFIGAMQVSELSGKRAETAYHASRVVNWYQTYSGISFGDFNLITIPYLSSMGGACSDGTTSNGLPATVTISCGGCASDQATMSEFGEASTRDSIYHELGHVASLSAWSGTYLWGQFGGDLPLCQSCLTEGVALFTAGFLSYFQGEELAYLGPNLKWPYDYYCSGHYRQGSVAFVNTWNDYTLNVGPIGFDVVAQHLSGLTNSTRMSDSSCKNTFTFEACANGNTFYRKLVDKAKAIYAKEWQTPYEVSKAYHARVSDYYPGTLTCPAEPDEDDKPTASSPVVDYFPWYDDVTNIRQLAPFLETWTRTSTSSLSGATYEPNVAAGETCVNDLVLGRIECKPLALDYSDDIDNYSFNGVSGQQYYVWTTVSGGTDTVIEIRNDSGALLATNDDCTGMGLASCLNYAPTASQTFRITVRPFSGANTGSAKRYTINVKRVGDDHGNTMAAASPMPPDGDSQRIAYINYAGDADYMYAIKVNGLTRPLYVYGCAFSGLDSLKVTIYDKNGGIVTGPRALNCESAAVLIYTSGTYYVKYEAYDASKSGQYVYSITMDTPVGTSQSSGFDLMSSGSVYPWGGVNLRVLPSVIPAYGSQYFRIYGALGESIQANVDVAKTYLYKELDLGLEAEEVGVNNTAYNDLVFRNIPSTSEANPILRDDHGSFAGSSEPSGWPSGARVEGVIPWNGYYYIKVSNKSGNSVGYTLTFKKSGTMGDYPEEP